MLLNPCALMDIHQVAILIHRAHAPCHMSIVGQGVVKLVADHGILVSVIILHQCQLVINHVKCLFPIIIICIDDCKRPVNQILTAQHCMGGAPGLHAALRDLKPFRYLIHLLIHICHIHISADTVAYVDLEFRLNGLLDDKDNLLKSSLFCIKNGEINDDVAILIHRVNLF